MDDELRACEQRLRVEATPDARVALARALERVGRRDDAHALLAEDPWPDVVREALRERPCWSAPSGNAGRTRHVDVPGLRRSPRVRWRSPALLDEDDLARLAFLGAATPWGIALVIVDDERDAARTIVLEPMTGAMQASIDHQLDLLGVIDGVAVAHNRPELAAWDLRSGACVWRVKLDATGVIAMHRGSLVVVVDGHITTLKLDDPRRAPMLPSCSRTHHVATWTGDRAILSQFSSDPRRTTCVRPSEGMSAPVWIRGPAIFCDDRFGTIGSDEDGLFALDAHGKESWRVDGCVSSLGLAVTPERVSAVREQSDDGLFIRCRRSGDVIRGDLPGIEVTAARDVFYVTDVRPELVAYSADDGAELWRMEGEEVASILPAWGGRAYVALRSGAVLCLEEEGA